MRYATKPYRHTDDTILRKKKPVTKFKPAKKRVAPKYKIPKTPKVSGYKWGG